MVRGWDYGMHPISKLALGVFLLIWVDLREALGPLEPFQEELYLTWNSL